MGAQRLPAHLRGLHAAGRPRRRPDRTPPGAGPRDGGVRARVPERGARPERGAPDRGPSRAGRRRRDDDARRPVARDDELQRRRRPSEGARRLGGDRRARLRAGRVPRRGPVGRPRLALGLLRERSCVRPGRARGEAPARAGAPSRSARQLRRARGGPRDRGNAAVDLRDRARPRRRLGCVAHGRRARRGGAAAGAVRTERAPASAPAVPLLDPAHQRPRRRRRHPDGRRGRLLLDVLLPDALHAGSARVLPRAGGSRPMCRRPSRSGCRRACAHS